MQPAALSAGQQAARALHLSIPLWSVRPIYRPRN